MGPSPRASVALALTPHRADATDWLVAISGACHPNAVPGVISETLLEQPPPRDDLHLARPPTQRRR